MIKQPNMKFIGSFILLSVAAFILMLAYFFHSKFSDKDLTVVMYFDESVRGLDVGAPVLFKGVKVGEVTSINLQANFETMQFLTSVYAKIYDSKPTDEDKISPRELLNRYIESGLRARLAVSSVITGQLLIEIDLFPGTEVVLHPVSKYCYEIPTIDSPFAEISKTLQVMPITNIVQDIHRITQTLDKELPTLLSNTSAALASINSILNENKADTKLMVSRVGAAAQSFDALVDGNTNNLTTMIENLSAAAASMKNLTDYLQINPSAIITGKGH